MLNGGFTDLLLLALAATLVVAAVIDVRTFTISNRLNAAVAAGAPLYWVSIALNPWPGMAIQLAAGAIVFVLLAGGFFSRRVGGGGGQHPPPPPPGVFPPGPAKITFFF